MNCVFWGVLAGLFLALAIWTWWSGKPILKDLDTLAKEGPDSMIGLGNHIISLNENVHKAIKGIMITSIIGFFLTSIAAVISAF
jgi:hypothetical protein